MNIAHIQFPVFNPYNKAGIEIYVSGCTRNCSKCHNEALKDFKHGKEAKIHSIISYLQQRVDLFEVIIITGGDLLCQDATEAFKFAFDIRNAFPTKELWLFTGEDNIDNIPLWAKAIFDVIKYGSYKAELKQEGFPASSNQQIWRKNEIQRTA
jgi:organic radical activating enzyme